MDIKNVFYSIFFIPFGFGNMAYEKPWIVGYTMLCHSHIVTQEKIRKNHIWIDQNGPSGHSIMYTYAQ